MTPTCRPATDADIAAFYGKPHSRTMRAWVMELAGRPIALGGVAYHRGRPWDMFSDIRPEAKKYPLAIVKAARSVLRSLNCPVVTMAGEEHAHSERLLLMLGFKALGHRGFRWDPE